MHVIEYPSGAALLDHAGAFLYGAEVENSIILAVAEALGSAPASYLASVDEGDAVLAVALQTPGRKLVVTRAPDAAVELLIRHRAERPGEVPGVLGPADVARAFAEGWSQRAHEATRLFRSERAHILTKVTPVANVAGRLRLAAHDEADLLAAWDEGFGRETGLGRQASADLARLVATSTLFVWETNVGPVAMAALTGRTRNGIRITLVYTPPAERRRGYASALVAALSQRALDDGRRFCCLFTDLANPTANHIYAAIGYTPVSDLATWELARIPPGTVLAS